MVQATVGSSKTATDRSLALERASAQVCMWGGNAKFYEVMRTENMAVKLKSPSTTLVGRLAGLASFVLGRRCAIALDLCSSKLLHRPHWDCHDCTVTSA